MRERLLSVRGLTTRPRAATEHLVDEPQPPARLPPGPAPPQAPRGAPAQPVLRCVIDGLAWTFRAPAGGMLRSVPAGAWTDPAAQGWQRIKHNPRRTVWRAHISGAAYYLKYYFERGWRAALRRAGRAPACQGEWESGVYALRAGIPAVRPVACAERLVGPGRCACSLLITEAVEPAYALHEFWTALCTDDDVLRRRRDATRLIDLLAEMIARSHQAGLEHRDMHAANILVHPRAPGQYETVFVDLQGARLGRPLGDHAVVRNLAQLNQWFRRHASLADRLRFLRRYLRWRDEYEHAYATGRPLGLSFPQLVRALAVQADRHAAQLWAKRDRRARRDGRYFARLRLPGGWRAIVFLSTRRPVVDGPAAGLTLERDWWRAQLAAPQRWFDAAASQTCKQSHSALVRRAVLGAGDRLLPVIVKRPLARNGRRALRQLFPPSRSMRGWRVGNALLNRDIPAARPLAVLERRLGPLVRDSLLLTEALPGAVDLEAHLRQQFARCAPRQWWRHKRELSALLARRLRELAERGYVHRDCKAQNLLVVTHPALNLVWTDMDGLKRAARPALARQLRAVARLHLSLGDVPGLTRGDRARFLKAFLARFGSDPSAWRAAWKSIAHDVARGQRARRQRRLWKLKHYGRP